MRILHNIYSDVDQSCETSKKTDLNSILQSINNIVTTPKGTRLFLRDFGCDLESILFELMNSNAKDLILNEILVAITKWEDRVLVSPINSDIELDYINNTVIARIAFKIKGLSETDYTIANIVLDRALLK